MSEEASLDTARLLHMLLSTVSAADTEDGHACLLTTSIPSLVRCDLSGIVLEGDPDRVFLQLDGELLSGSDTQALRRDLEPLLGRIGEAPVGGCRPSDPEAMPPPRSAAGMRSFEMVAIRTLSSNSGLLLAGRREETPFSAEETSLMHILAGQTAVAIEKYRLEARLREQAHHLEQMVEERTSRLQHSERRLRLLLDTNNAIIGLLSPSGLCSALARHLRPMIDFDRVKLSLMESGRENFYQVAASADAESVAIHPPEIPFSESVLTPILDAPRTMVREHLEEHGLTGEELESWRVGMRSYMATPLVSGGRPVGVLTLESRAARDWDEAEIVADLSSQVSLAVANMMAYEEIERLKVRLELENKFLQEEVETQRSKDIVGDSPSINRLLERIDRVAGTDASVMVLGESGTGKELVAREIHRRSARCEGPMVKVNCASIPRELFESEYFGHVKGAFTGATRDRAGRFEMAHGGTLFMDEVGEIPMELQARLLRVLQEGEYERVGSERTRTTDVRVVAATNRDLELEVEEGRFRQDLFFRLNVFPIRVPPLRERKEDIPLLAVHFIQMACRRWNRPLCALTARDLERLQSYDWPGNVRELQNAIEHALILAGGKAPRFAPPASPGLQTASTTTGLDAPSSSIRTLDDLKVLERSLIVDALEECEGRVHGSGGAAERLGIHPSTLFSRMKSMGIPRRGSKPR